MQGLTISKAARKAGVGVETIEANLLLEAGTARVKGNAKTNKVLVTYRSWDISADEIESTVNRLGHRVDRTEGRRVA